MFGKHADARGRSGKMAPATRDDLAAANVAVLTQPGHENKAYTLTGSDAASYREVEKILSEIKGKPVPFIDISEEEYIENWVDEGVPAPVGMFGLAWVKGTNSGEFAEQPAT